MIVCLIAEGSYPYITGGVSSWIHQLITGIPDINFKVLSIMPSHKEKLKYRYLFPDNLLEVKTIYLDDYLNLKQKGIRKKIFLNAKNMENITNFFYMDKSVDWEEIIKLIVIDRKLGNTVEFLQSELFWDIMVQYYQEKYSDENFNTFFWTIRTMLLPFINIIQDDPIEADIYHSVSTGYAGILGVSLHDQMQKPFLLTEHGIYAREREEEILKAPWVTGIYKRLWIDFFYFISQAAYKEADKIIALFERNQDIQRELGAPIDKTEIISNGVDIKKYNTKKQEHDDYIVGAILRIVPIKDVMTLIRAFKIVRDYFESVKLYLIGPTDEDPEYYGQCKRLVELLDLKNDVIFTGSVNVQDYLKIIDVMVLTSISEGQPLVILEAMASGIPVVSTDVGSCRELLAENSNEGFCGVLTNLVSPNETAGQIINLLNNKDLRLEMGRNGRKRAESTYSKEIFLSNYKRTYQKLGWLYGRNRLHIKKDV